MSNFDEHNYFRMKELCNEYLLFLSVVYSVNSILMIFQFKFVEYFNFHFLKYFDRLQRKIWMNWYRHGNFVNLKCTLQKQVYHMHCLVVIFRLSTGSIFSIYVCSQSRKEYSFDWDNLSLFFVGKEVLTIILN